MASISHWAIKVLSLFVLPLVLQEPESGPRNVLSQEAIQKFVFKFLLYVIYNITCSACTVLVSWMSMALNYDPNFVLGQKKDTGKR